MSELRPLFGEDYSNAYGFNEEIVQLSKGHIHLPLPSSVEKRLTSTLAIMENSEDVKGICKALHITEKEMLALHLYGLKYFETLVSFIKDNVKSKTLVCSIYVITHEIRTKASKPTEKHIKKISKILLGHHILLCIPIEEGTVQMDAIEAIMKNKTELTTEILQSFQQDGIAIYNFEDIHKKPAVEIIKDSRQHVFGERKALLVQLTDDLGCNWCNNEKIAGYYYFLLISGAIVILSFAFGNGKK